MLLVVFNDSLIIQYLQFEQSTGLAGEDKWYQGPYYSEVLVVNSSYTNATLEIPWTHHIEIVHFNVTPGPVTIIVRASSEVILNHTIVSGNLVSGLPPPSSSVSFGSYSTTVGHNISVFYEGVNSTVGFLWSNWASGHFDYPVLYNRTVTVTAQLFGYGLTGFIGGILILGGAVAIFVIRGSRQNPYRRMNYDDRVRA